MSAEEPIEFSYPTLPFPLALIHKDGRVERLVGNENIPASVDPVHNVRTKDIQYSIESSSHSARVYLPETIKPNQKLPLFVYFHGGGFVVESAFSPMYHPFVEKVVKEANVIAVSVNYRRAPEHPLPAAYDDSFAALKWIASHVKGDGPEEWLNSHADFQKVFLAGDSAGGSITHHMALTYGEKEKKIEGFNIAGIVLVHALFASKDLIGKEIDNPHTKIMEELWHIMHPSTTGLDDPFLNPTKDPRFANLGCDKVLILVAGDDYLRDRGYWYSEQLVKNGYGGKVEIAEDKGENHVFHLFQPDSENAAVVLKRFVSFMNV